MPFVVQAGPLSGGSHHGMRSDLPRQITAQATEAVYDSPIGQYLLIPQGARLIGQYESFVAFGQSRLLLVWKRLIMPDGTSIVLERQAGADTGGYAGLVPWGPDSVIGVLWSSSSAPFPSTCSGCLFRSRTGPSRTT